MVVCKQIIGNNKNAGKLLAILITMQMQWCNVWHTAQWSTSRASLEATGCCHRTAQAATMVDEFVAKHKTLPKHNFKLAIILHFYSKTK
jgi:hypothetical protein